METGPGLPPGPSGSENIAVLLCCLAGFLLSSSGGIGVGSVRSGSGVVGIGGLGFAAGLLFLSELEFFLLFLFAGIAEGLGGSDVACGHLADGLLDLTPGAVLLPAAVPLAGGDQQVDEQDEEDGRRDERCHDDRLEAHGVGGDAGCVGVVVVHAVPADEQAVGVDAVGRAGDQCTEILIGIDLEILQLLGENDSNLVNLIGEGAVEDLEQELVARLELVDVGEQLRGRQASVSGHRAVGALAADRE